MTLTPVPGSMHHPGGSGVPTPIRDGGTQPIDVPHPHHEPSAPKTDTHKQVESVLAFFMGAGFPRRYVVYLATVLTLVLGFIAPAMERFSSEGLAFIFGVSTDSEARFTAIELKLDAAAEERKADRKAAAEQRVADEKAVADQRVADDKKAAEQRRTDQAALAELIRLVESLDLEAANAGGRKAKKLPAKLQLVVTQDEVGSGQ